MIISGLDIIHPSYVDATNVNLPMGNGEGQNAIEVETVEEQVVKFINDNVIDLDPKDISICHFFKGENPKSKEAQK